MPMTWAAPPERFQDSYQGEFDSLGDWAEHLLEDMGTLKEVPESLRGYIDFESWARDAELNGEVYALEQGSKVHVFWR